MPKQEEIFGEKYSPEDISRITAELVADVTALNDMEAEKAEVLKGYSDSIKILKFKIQTRIGALREAKRASQKFTAVSNQ